MDNGYIKHYYWDDDHPLPQGTNDSYPPHTLPIAYAGRAWCHSLQKYESEQKEIGWLAGSIINLGMAIKNVLEKDATTKILEKSKSCVYIYIL